MSSTFKISNGDVVISNVSGKPTLISDNVKISQDVKEFFTVNITTYGFGAGLEDLVGVTGVDSNIFMGLAHKQVVEGIDEFINLQNSDSRIARVANERVAGINHLNISQDPQDPTKFYFRANVVTEGGEVIDVPIVTVQ